jgi:GH15 family glucan-1,4-alpha-glucosidase
MCWVALDRMVRLAREYGRPADLARWISERDRIYDQIMDHGWNPQRRAFTQHDQTDVLDASLLMMPLTDFVVSSDPMWLSTLDAMETELVSDCLVYRYNPSASPDGLRGKEGTFSICTFWYVDALARSGRLEQARLTLEKMFTYANHLGLFAEEIGLTGEQLGNFPPGVHPPLFDQRRYQPQPQARPRHRPRHAPRVPIGGPLIGRGSGGYKPKARGRDTLLADDSHLV